MILERLFEKRASLENPSTSLSDPANWLFQAFGAQPSTSKIVVTDRNVNQITAFWSAVGTIADTLAELPIKLVQIKRNGSTKAVKSHPALPLLTLSPNPMMNAVVGKSTSMAHVLTWGNGFVWIKRNRARQPLELWPLMPHETTAVVANEKLYFDSKLSIGPTRIAAQDIIHIPAISRNGLMGMSIIAEQREMLGSIIATQQFGSRFFANGARAGGMVSYPGKVRDPEKIREAIERATGGDNQHGMLVLSDDAKFQQFSVPPEDAQFLGTREFGVDEVARMFRLPLHFLNKMGQATFNNLEQMGSHFAQYTMMPWIIRHEQEYTRKLLTPDEIKKGLRFKFNLSALMRGDIKTRSEVYAKAIQFGWYTRNEVRALEDMNPLEGLDEPLVPLNLGVVGEEMEPQPDPEPVEPEPGQEPPEDEEESEEDDRSFLILTAAAQRLANRESIAVERIIRSGKDGDDIKERLDEFYRQHEKLLMQNLAMTPEHARQYCRNHQSQIFSGNIDEMMLDWTNKDVMDLVNQISEDL